MQKESSRLGTTSPSFEVAAENLNRLTGVAMSPTTLWRIHREVGEAMLAVQEGEEAVSSAPLEVEEEPGEERLPASDPVVGERVCLSLDGTTVLVREEGWKEVKGVSISVLEESPPAEPGGEKEVHLTRHSYRMRLADAATFAQVQGAEADRRRAHYARDLECVNDGASWCWRITSDYYPEAQEVLDWSHALEHVNAVAQAAFGEGSEEAAEWYKKAEADLWQGAVETLLGERWQELPRRQRERGKTIRNGRAYFQEHRERMRYRDFREKGYAIGSGVIESACKNVVGWRMKRGGMRWAAERVNPVLATLSELHSGRWDEMWSRIWPKAP